MVWADGIYIFAHTPAKLAQMLSTLGLLLQWAGLCLHPVKTQWCTTSAEFEGHLVRCSGKDLPCMNRPNGLKVLGGQMSFTNASYVAVNHRCSAAWQSFFVHSKDLLCNRNVSAFKRS